jgi:hypothetical protein
MEAKQRSDAEVQSAPPVAASAVDGSDYKIEPARKPMFGAVAGYFASTLERQIERLTVGSTSFPVIACRLWCACTAALLHVDLNQSSLRSAHARWTPYPVALLERGSL